MTAAAGRASGMNPEANCTSATDQLKIKLVCALLL